MNYLYKAAQRPSERTHPPAHGHRAAPRTEGESALRRAPLRDSELGLRTSPQQHPGNSRSSKAPADKAQKVWTAPYQTMAAKRFFIQPTGIQLSAGTVLHTQFYFLMTTLHTLFQAESVLSLEGGSEEEQGSTSASTAWFAQHKSLLLFTAKEETLFHHSTFSYCAILQGNFIGGSTSRQPFCHHRLQEKSYTYFMSYTNHLCNNAGLEQGSALLSF